MKKIISALCCIALMLTLSAVPVFAADNTTSTSVEESVITRATSRGLYYKDNMFFQGIHTCTVTPESGANLNIWLKNNNTVKVYVYKTNILGMYSKIYTQTFTAGERDVRVETKCNGKPYLVKLESAVDGSIASFLIYQN